MKAAITIEHLRTLTQENIGLAYVLCNYQSQIDQDIYGLLSALLKQLAQVLPDIDGAVKRFYDHHTRRNSRPDFEDLSTVRDRHENMVRMLLDTGRVDIHTEFNGPTAL